MGKDQPPDLAQFLIADTNKSLGTSEKGPVEASSSPSAPSGKGVNIAKKGDHEKVKAKSSFPGANVPATSSRLISLLLDSLPSEACFPSAYVWLLHEHS